MGARRHLASSRAMAGRRPYITCAAACLWAAASYGELLPISAFTDPADYGTVAISPTGEYLALTMRHEGGAIFRVVTYPDNEIKVNRNFGEDREIADLLWVGDQHVLVFPANSLGRVEGLGRTGELMVVPVEGGIVRRLGWGTVLDVLPDDPAHILIQTARDRFLEAYKVNVVSPSARAARNPLTSANRVGRGAAPWGGLMPDHAGRITLSTGQTADDQTEVYHREGRGEWQLVQSHAYAEPGWTPLRYAGTSGKFYTFDSRGAATVGLGIYDPRRQQPRQDHRAPSNSRRRIHVVRLWRAESVGRWLRTPLPGCGLHSARPSVGAHPCHAAQDLPGRLDHLHQLQPRSQLAGGVDSQRSQAGRLHDGQREVQAGRPAGESPPAPAARRAEPDDAGRVQGARRLHGLRLRHQPPKRTETGPMVVLVHGGAAPSARSLGLQQRSAIARKPRLPRSAGELSRFERLRGCLHARWLRPVGRQDARRRYRCHVAGPWRPA